MSLFITSLKKGRHDEETLKETKNENKSFILNKNAPQLFEWPITKRMIELNLKKSKSLFAASNGAAEFKTRRELRARQFDTGRFSLLLCLKKNTNLKPDNLYICWAAKSKMKLISSAGNKSKSTRLQKTLNLINVFSSQILSVISFTEFELIVPWQNR